MLIISDKIKSWCSDIEASALEQLHNTASLPIVVSHVAAMPDAHWGMGATVGSVIATRDAICPAAVGVDIGCGMQAVRTSLTDVGSLVDLRHNIERTIPTGFHQHAEPQVENHELWSEFKDLDPGVKGLFAKARKQIGTLGGGNHFIEVCLDEAGRVWLMLHSGSRNIGKELAGHHIAIAKQQGQDVKDPDLAYFLAGTKEMANYRRDLFWAQRYAALNRGTMMWLLKSQMVRRWPDITFDEEVSCHHNYVAEETYFGEKLFITRKGAIDAHFGIRGIIPGSMGTKSFIVEGLGNPESFNSASHGAGRKMSRSHARKNITLERFNETTQGVECRRDIDILDEAPDAYKDIDTVMSNQSDLVRIVHTLKQIVCVKG